MRPESRFLVVIAFVLVQPASAAILFQDGGFANLPLEASSTDPANWFLPPQPPPTPTISIIDDMNASPFSLYKTGVQAPGNTRAKAVRREDGFGGQADPYVALSTLPFNGLTVYAAIRIGSGVFDSSILGGVAGITYDYSVIERVDRGLQQRIAILARDQLSGDVYGAPDILTGSNIPNWTTQGGSLAPTDFTQWYDASSNTGFPSSPPLADFTQGTWEWYFAVGNTGIGTPSGTVLGYDDIRIDVQPINPPPPAAVPEPGSGVVWFAFFAIGLPIIGRPRSARQSASA